MGSRSTAFAWRTLARQLQATGVHVPAHAAGGFPLRYGCERQRRHLCAWPCERGPAHCARARRPVTVALYAGPDSATCARLSDRLLLVAASDRDSGEVAASGWQPTVVVSTPFSVKPTRSQHDPATAAVARAGPGRRGFELAELLGRTPPTGPPASSSSSQSLETDQSPSVDI